MKRETKLNLLVPLTIFISYGFDLHYWRVPKSLPSDKPENVEQGEN